MDILIVGGGYIGMYTARRLERLLRRGEATVTVVDPRGYMTYQPFLAEAAAGWLAHRAYHLLWVPSRPDPRDRGRAVGSRPGRALTHP
jgi:NADH dehydrogenase FAD-containing subunit